MSNNISGIGKCYLLLYIIFNMFLSRLQMFLPISPSHFLPIFHFLFRWTVSSVMSGQRCIMGGNDVITVCLFVLKQTERFLNEIQGGTVYSELSLEQWGHCAVYGGCWRVCWHCMVLLTHTNRHTHCTVAALIRLQLSENITSCSATFLSSQL